MGEAGKPVLFECFHACCPVVLRGRRGSFWHSNLCDNVWKMSKLEEVSHEMLVFLHPRVSFRVSGCPVASPCLWGKLGNLTFSNVSKQVVLSFCVAGVAVSDIPTCVITCGKCQNWRKSRTKCSFFCTHVSRFESLVVLWRRRVYGGSWKTLPFRMFPSRLSYSSHFTLYTAHSTLHTLHSTLPCTLHSTLHTLHFTLSISRSWLYTPHFTLHTFHSTLHTPHFTLHTLHSWVVESLLLWCELSCFIDLASWDFGFAQLQDFDQHTEMQMSETLDWTRFQGLLVCWERLQHIALAVDRHRVKHVFCVDVCM